MASHVLPSFSQKDAVDRHIRDTLDKVAVLRFGRVTEAGCLQLDDILAKASREVSRFASIALVDADAPDTQVYIKYFDITMLPVTLFFFNAEHMKMESGTQDNTKWVGPFASKQDFIDVVETIFRGAMRGKHIVTCPIPAERIPKYNLLYKDV